MHASPSETTARQRTDVRTIRFIDTGRAEKFPSLPSEAWTYRPDGGSAMLLSDAKALGIGKKPAAAGRS